MRDCIRFPVDNGGLLLFPALFAQDGARLFDALQREAHWEQHAIHLFGRRIPAPRLSAWHGEPGCDYRYSGTSYAPAPLSAAMRAVRARIEDLLEREFNAVLLNLYRDGNDAMSWHSDDEAELGPAPCVASVSLGATRRFLLRSRADHARRFALDLPGGSLLLMEPPLQAHWQHALPRTRRPCGPRLNLTWRRIHGGAAIAGQGAAP